MQQVIDIVDVVQRIIQEELQVGDHAQLVAFPCAQFVTYLPCPGTDHFEQGVLVFRGKKTEIDPGDGKVFGNADLGNRYQRAGKMIACLFLENSAEILLDEAGDFLLTSRFHRAKVVIIDN